MSEWISVADRLPEEYQKVLVGREGAENVFALIMYRKDQCNSRFWQDSCVNMFASPTHWHPVTKINK